MKKGIIFPKSRIERAAEREGQSIEQMMRKAVGSNEPIQATAKVQYTERKDGVLPQYDIRTDRFNYAMLATDKVNASNAAARHKVDFPEQYDENGNLKPEAKN